MTWPESIILTVVILQVVAVVGAVASLVTAWNEYKEDLGVIKEVETDEQ